MNFIENESVDLMITSPPYPMIEMWDGMFSAQNQKISEALKNQNGHEAFELMHQELDKTWAEVYRILKSGGIACINIGDATRKINDSFKLYANHAKILSSCMQLGFDVLPEILWRKESNKPNKFMGSGMLPVCAYVTLEHEFILILRKNHKREFKTEEEKRNRHKSAFYWEERNVWFSDIWNIKGSKQNLYGNGNRERSAAYPFELAHRLINMFSVKGDTVLDPFLGTGTTTLAAIASQRNSVGIEIDKTFGEIINERLKKIVKMSNEYNENRIKRHLNFVETREVEKGKLKYSNNNYNFPIMTRQEIKMKIPSLKFIKALKKGNFEIEYD